MDNINKHTRERNHSKNLLKNAGSHLFQTQIQPPRFIRFPMYMNREEYYDKLLPHYQSLMLSPILSKQRKQKISKRKSSYATGMADLLRITKRSARIRKIWQYQWIEHLHRSGCRKQYNLCRRIRQHRRWIRKRKKLCQWSQKIQQTQQKIQQWQYQGRQVRQ